MVICCPGRINSQAHCDDSKGDQDISFSLFTTLLEDSIRYSTSNGAISSTREQWDLEINNILKLNNGLLKKNRLKALEGVKQLLEKENWRAAIINNQLEYWTSFHLDPEDDEMKKKEYCGIVIRYLRKTLRRP